MSMKEEIAIIEQRLLKACKKGEPVYLGDVDTEDFNKIDSEILLELVKGGYAEEIATKLHSDPNLGILKPEGRGELCLLAIEQRYGWGMAELGRMFLSEIIRALGANQARQELDSQRQKTSSLITSPGGRFPN